VERDNRNNNGSSFPHCQALGIERREDAEGVEEERAR
jgi:hypothetical protein